MPESCEVTGAGKVDTHIWTLSLSPDVGNMTKESSAPGFLETMTSSRDPKSMVKEYHPPSPSGNNACYLLMDRELYITQS